MTLAIVTRVATRPHPNADRLQLGNVLGYQVVVGMSTQDGELGVFFPEGLQLSEAYAEANSLVRRKDPETGQYTGGFFEETRRVRCQKFRQEKSEGYWAPLSSLDFTGYPTHRLKEGDRFSDLNGVVLCQKYVTVATRTAGSRNRTNSRKETPMFRAHFETDQLRFNYDRIAPTDLVVLTLKMHGTSQRVGRVRDEIALPWWKQWVNRRYPVFPTEDWAYLIGSRNVILGRVDGPGYHSDEFRQKAAEPFLGKLHKGEAVYYEVVGYERLGVPVMARHSTAGLKDKEIEKRYGKEVTYHYGCPDGQFGVYVYRITLANEDGHVIDLPWEMVKQRCAELAVKHVPEFTPPFIVRQTDVSLTDIVGGFVEGDDPVGLNHPREGVCVRVENGKGCRIFKHKSFVFGVLEGYVKEREDYVDAEEAA